MSLKRILFVDDEVQILDGLRNVLRKQRHTWDMVFAVGGAAALAEFERGPFDVIVTDMRMPGMDGAALLQRVKDVYPSTARIILSGHAQREAAERAIPVAHQFVSKPCDVDLLRAVIDRTCNLQAMLHDERLRALISRLGTLPSAPRAFFEITRAAAKSDTSTDDIAGIVEKDPALVAKVLQVVNSAYFGVAHAVSSIGEAVRYLGVDIMKSLALSEHVLATMNCPDVPGFDLEELQRHSWLTARLAKRLLVQRRRADDAYTAAIVHDLGKLVLACAAPEQYAAIIEEARRSGRRLHEVERERLEATHAEAGAYLLGVWGLPFWMVEAVAFHHTPHHVAAGERDIVLATHVADALADTARTDSAGQMEEAVGAIPDGEHGLVRDQSEWTTLVREETLAVAAS